MVQTDLWGICAYFNPLGFTRRILNYRTFRRHLGIPLLTVEYGYRGHFDLDQGDADLLIRCGGGDILWHRERLLNIALSALPSTCQFVVRLDGDIVFADPDWHHRVRGALSHSALVQPFEEAQDLPPDVKGDPTNYFQDRQAWSGFACSWNKHPDPNLLERRIEHGGSRSKCAMGLAWAFRRDLHKTLTLYDACVLGGADHAVLCAACGVPEIVVDYQRMGAAWASHYKRWADRFQHRIDGQIGYVEGKLGHLWHGHVAHRGYGTRYRDFAKYAFDPHIDLARNSDGSWRWATDKPKMQEYVRRYFNARREDG